ncbi:DUF6957 family protein [Pseudomonas rhizophila]
MTDRYVANVQELAAEGKKPVMMLMLNVVFDSGTKTSTAFWLRSSPLINFSDVMFFQTQNKLYVLLGNGRRKRCLCRQCFSFFDARGGCLDDCTQGPSGGQA